MQRCFLGLVLFSFACGGSDGPTYYGDAKPILDARCVTCHQPGDIGPFPLTTLDEVREFAGPVRAAIANGTMPPWQPSDECNSYVENIDLTPDEREMLIQWLDEGARAGNPADEPLLEEEDDDEFVATVMLQLPEPYTPTREPDDYRCQLIEWPGEETQYVTGARVTPDQRSIVHHVILFLADPDQVEQYRAYDEAEEGPGYTCYGGPRANDEEGGGLGDLDPAEVLTALDGLGLTPADLRAGMFTPEQLATLMDELGVDAAGGFRTIGSWVPGVTSATSPPGTGIRVEPGSMIVAQFHYNTLSSAPVPDQSTIEIATTDSVEREATMLPALDIGWVTNGLVGGNAMSIPAGEPEVEHSTVIGFDSFFLIGARRTLGLADDAPLVIHGATHHMHELGTRQHSELAHADGSMSCVLDIPDWDFAWQGRYTLTNPIAFGPGDELRMGCTWNNTAANQPIIDGEAREPVDVSWGEGTTDEMCLAAYYVTGE